VESIALRRRSPIVVARIPRFEGFVEYRYFDYGLDRDVREVWFVKVSPERVECRYIEPGELERMGEVELADARNLEFYRFARYAVEALKQGCCPFCGERMKKVRGRRHRYSPLHLVDVERERMYTCPRCGIEVVVREEITEGVTTGLTVSVSTSRGVAWYQHCGVSQDDFGQLTKFLGDLVRLGLVEVV